MVILNNLVVVVVVVVVLNDTNGVSLETDLFQAPV